MKGLFIRSTYQGAFKVDIYRTADAETDAPTFTAYFYDGGELLQSIESLNSYYNWNKFFKLVKWCLNNLNYSGGK